LNPRYGITFGAVWGLSAAAPPFFIYISYARLVWFVTALPGATATSSRCSLSRADDYLSSSSSSTYYSFGMLFSIVLGWRINRLLTVRSLAVMGVDRWCQQSAHTLGSDLSVLSCAPHFSNFRFFTPADLQSYRVQNTHEP
jgi:hypothetical protein